LNGDVCITAARNGRVRIKAKNVQIEASEDIDLKAGRNINLTASNGRILQNANKCDVKALTGNAIPETFGMKVFKGSFLGLDLIKASFTIDVPLIGGVEIGI